MEVGLKLGDAPDRWVVADAAPPAGSLLPGYQESDRLGAIGDSALVDALGFGAMTSVSLPAAAAKSEDSRSEDSRSKGLGSLLPLRHRSFSRTGIHIGIPARKIECGSMPEIVLGILDRSGKGGRIGGGIYRPPPELFTAASAALN